MKELLRKAFEAGRIFGQDEVRSNAMKYSWEVTEPDFEKWYEQVWMPHVRLIRKIWPKY